MENEQHYERHEQKWYRERRLSSILDLGELMLESGAEVDRIEDTISRLCDAYGYTRTDVFCILSSIIVTAHCPDGEILTQTKRIRQRNTDMGRVEKLNDLSRQLCKTPVTVEKQNEMIDAIRNAKKVPPVISCLMYIMISGAFALFFGGNFLDAACACISGMVLYLVLMLSAKADINNLLAGMACCALTGMVVMLLVKAGIGQHADKIMIGNIMLVIPGVGLTTSLRDIINGDMITGMIGICEALTRSIVVALGFAAAAIWFAL